MKVKISESIPFMILLPDLVLELLEELRGANPLTLVEHYF